MSPLSLDSTNLVAITRPRRKTCQRSSPETVSQRDLPTHDKLLSKRVLDKLLQAKSSGRLLIIISDHQKLEVRQRPSCARHSRDKSLAKSVRSKSLRLESSSKHLIADLWKPEKIKHKRSRVCRSKRNVHSHVLDKRVLKSGKKMAGNNKRKQPEDDLPPKSEYVAMDCEFVGAGPKRQSAIGRCSVVDFDGHVLCDIYAKPDEPVTDYRTQWSGIRPRDLINAVPFENARNIVRAALKDRIVVGHAVHNDFKVLKLSHPPDRIRDTSTYTPLRRMAGLPLKSLPSLKKLTKNLLGKVIQTGEHSSVEDSIATMMVFKLVRQEWEEGILDEQERRNAQRNKRSRRDDDSTTTDSGSSCGSSNASSCGGSSCGSSNASSNASSCGGSSGGGSDDDLSYLSDSFWPDDIDR